jgi:hypothetical protein
LWELVICGGLNAKATSEVVVWRIDVYKNAGMNLLEFHGVQAIFMNVNRTPPIGTTTKGCVQNNFMHFEAESND